MTDYSLALSRDRPSHDRDAFSRRHPKMSLQNRAKIFAPFDALPDLRWKVAERQKITRPPARLTEDARELLDRKLRWLDRYCRSDPDRDRPPEELNGDGIRGNYRETTGMVSRVDASACFLQIIDMKIPFGDIYVLEGDLFRHLEDPYEDPAESAAVHRQLRLKSQLLIDQDHMDPVFMLGIPGDQELAADGIR